MSICPSPSISSAFQAGLVDIGGAHISSLPVLGIFKTSPEFPELVGNLYWLSTLIFPKTLKSPLISTYDLFVSVPINCNVSALNLVFPVESLKLYSNSKP